MKKLWSLMVLLALVAVACGSATVSNADTGSADDTSSADSTSPVVTTGSVALASSVERADADATAPTGQLAAGFNDAGFDILRDQDAAANTVLSPVSIGHAVLMARAAADEATGAAIDVALALPDGIAAHEAWNAIDQLIADANGVATNLEGEPTPTVTIADRIWPSQTTTPDQEWVDLLAAYHGSDVSTIDVTQPEASRELVNTWVSDETQGLIPELLPPGFIDGNTTLVLTDTIYFEAQWRSIFGKYGTVDADFTQLDGETVPTTFMRDLENSGARGVGDGWSAAELPYAGDGFSMLVIVPDEGRYDEIREGLSNDLLAEVDAAIEPGPYELLLPQWEDDSSIDLLPWLTAIGAAPGSYPAISPASELTGGVHAADIAVDDIGTVAAAATGLGFAESGPPEPEFTIAADRPFFHLIRHNETGMVLFVGQVTNPNT